MSRFRLFAVIALCAFVPRLACADDKTPTPDPLGRTTPRSSIEQFLQACHDQKFVRADQYLDLSRIPAQQRGIEGPELANKLCLFLDRDQSFEVGHLDNTAAGRADDDLASDLDRLTSATENGRKVSLYLERQNHDGSQIWVVAAESVGQIGGLEVSQTEPDWVRDLPPWLVERQLLGTSLWSWFGLAILGLTLGLLSRALSRLIVFLVKPAARRYAPWLGVYRMGAFIDPLRLLLAVAVFRASMEAFVPSALLREYLLGLLVLLFAIGVASLLMRIVDVISDRVITRLDPAERALSYSVIPLSVRFLKICVFGIAVLFVLGKWGVQITTILAGVGVGGLAIALAAQKTIENLFGGISILTDRPVLVGDVCQFGGQTGTVADIGLRSTRLRTPDRTIVTIPNATFSTMTLENLSRRDRLLFHPKLQLRRDTDPGKIRELMHAIETMLRERSGIDATDVPVRFVSILPESFQIEIFSYVLTTDSAEFLRVQTELLLRILELAEQSGVRLAVPFAESIPAQMEP